MPVAVRYIVDDVDAAIDFYVSRLDFGVEMHPAPGFAALSRGDLILYLNEPGVGSGGQAGSDPSPGGWSRFQIETDDLDSLVAELRESGAGFRSDIVTSNAGRQILLEDPAGNVVELFEAAG